MTMSLGAIAACAPQAPARPSCPAGEVCILMGNGSEPATLDPHKATGTWESRILSDAFMGLTQDDAAGGTVPGMAERWETSEDGLVWTFHLREAVWSDGQPLSADDFVFSLQRILRPETASEYASLLYFIAGAQAINEGDAAAETLGVRALDSRTLEIRLVHPAPYILEVAKHQTMSPVPKHMVEKLGDAWVQPQNIVSNGPYMVQTWRLGDYVKLIKNPRFFEADTVCIDQVYYYPTTDAASAERRVRRGELDLNFDIQSNRIGFLREEIPDYVQTHTWLGVAYLAFNANVEALQDIRVRRAISMAIDREFITDKLLRGGQTPAYNYVPPGVANYVAPPLPEWASWPLERRQAEARRLLAEAGYTPARPLKLEIKHRNSPDPTLFMPAIQADLKEVGVDLSLAQNEVQIAYAAYRARDFQIADAGWVADYNDAMSFLYLNQTSAGAQNYGDYSNPAYDALLRQADNEPDAAIRAGYLSEAERIMLADAPIVPVYFLNSKALVSPRVTGWVGNIIDHHRTRYLCLEGGSAGNRGMN
ncbi:peptide ABC transporter substrate-binding protein [Phenylobacterium sp.]|uniref:peptide ABC transporter substrate-binding protein n=1 Tax=Phenylobacterium sp. TaxID=1871053 RepID=UPI002731CC01|nr:peptide ABC transporter substrate-binding protein [Phenylobacterium sp.]MDP1615838.1 peptide ABC transporter substrate-binding protein [Phenylobacterium sp.]MDP1986152.1 peptide ABC transporter substrate-binding protein [Phenylobacterium sp.]